MPYRPNQTSPGVRYSDIATIESVADLRRIDLHDYPFVVYRPTANITESDIFFFDKDSTASDDGISIIKPDYIPSANPGRWMRSLSLLVQDEGIALAAKATILNFAGAGVIASGTGSTKTITIPGGGGGSGVTVQDEGVTLATLADALNFTGAGVTASGTGSTKTVTIPGTTTPLLTVQDEGVTLGSGTDATSLNFVGAGVVATDAGGGAKTVTIAGGTTTTVGPVHLVIASAGATATERARADYVCDGTGDDVEILAAYAALGTYGGILELSAGRFFLQNPLVFNTANKTIILQGDGPSDDYSRGGTSITLNLSGNTNLNNSAMVKLGETNFVPRCIVRGITFDGRAPEGAAGLTQLDGILAASYKQRIENCKFMNLNGHGITLGSATRAATDTRIVDCDWQNIRGCGVTPTGSTNATDMHIIHPIASGCGTTTLGAAFGGGHAINLGAGTAGTMVRDGHLYSNFGAGINGTATVLLISDVKIENNNYGIDVSGSIVMINDVGFRGNSLTTDNATDNIRINGADYIFINGGWNVATTWPSGVADNQVRYAVNVVGTPSFIALSDHHIFTGLGTGGLNAFGTAKLNNFPAAGVLSNCVGLVTDKHGVITTAGAAGTSVVTHGLDVTPDLSDIRLTWRSTPGSGAVAYVTTPTSTQFTIGWAGVTGTPDLGWSYVRTRA